MGPSVRLGLLLPGATGTSLLAAPGVWSSGVNVGYQLQSAAWSSVGAAPAPWRLASGPSAKSAADEVRSISDVCGAGAGSSFSERQRSAVASIDSA